MAIEDFTTYTKFTDKVPDPLVVIATTITGTAVTRNEDSYVYDDKVLNHFDGDFTHLITTNVDNSVSVGNITSWALTNDIDDSQGLIGAGKTFFEMLHVAGVGYYIIEVYTGTPYLDFVNLTQGQTYYSTISRDESVGSFGQLICEIYSDSGRTILVDTLSVLLHAKIDFRYVFGLMSYDDNQAARTVDLTVSNLDLGEAAAVVIAHNVAFSIYDKQFDAFKELSGKNTII